MKKLVLTTAFAVMALGATAANAEIHVGIGINQPVYRPAPVVYYKPTPVYYQPAPAYYGPPYYYPSYYNGRDRHRNYDWRYWHGRDRDRDRWDEDHDNGNHKGWYKH